jgi:hypothetical protein
MPCAWADDWLTERDPTREDFVTHASGDTTPSDKFT